MDKIGGSLTMIKAPDSITLDSSNNIYVANSSRKITVYAAGANGNVAPVNMIEGPGRGFRIRILPL